MSLPRDEKRQWVPEICYEDYEDAQLTNGLPFIQIPTDKEMPNVLFFSDPVRLESFSRVSKESPIQLWKWNYTSLPV